MMPDAPPDAERYFYDLGDFPKLKELAAKWQIIREEFLGMDAPLLEIDRVGKTLDQVHAELNKHMEQGGKYGWLLGWSNGAPTRDWIQYGLVVRDRPIPYAAAAMPKTIELLSGIGGIKTCAFSKMRRYTFLPLHRHPEIRAEGLLQFHITIDVPRERNYAYLNVNGEFRKHELGDALVFDGSYDHFGLNASPHDRTILYMEFKKDGLMA